MFVSFKHVATGKELVFLVDTGADISIVKENSDVFHDIQDNYIIAKKGISQDVTKSKGLTSIEIQTTKYLIPHDFHIVDSQFAIPCDGILGIDFIKKYNCRLDCMPSEDWLVIRPNNLKFPIYVPITFSSGNNSILLPARSQVIRKIQLNSYEDSVLIPNQEIKHGIYIANTIATSNNAFIRLFYTTYKGQVVSTNNFAYESLSNYEVVNTNQENREKSVLSQLSKNFPAQFNSQLSSLCTKYSDIFGLENEPISTNNFYKQKLRKKMMNQCIVKIQKKSCERNSKTSRKVDHRRDC